MRRILDRLLVEVPGITLRTTLLLGFPGESEQDADEVAAFVREYRLGRLGAFTYSHEEGTPGFELENSLPEAAAIARRERVLAVRDEVLATSQRALIGSTIEVLVDEVHPGGRTPYAVARSRMDAPEVDLIARLRNVRARVGERVHVLVEDVDSEFNLLCAPLPQSSPGKQPAAHRP